MTVPDDNPVGIVDTRNITFDAAAVITGLEVRLNLTGGWNGDLFASLVHDSGYAVLLNRVGNTALDPAGSGSSGMTVTFSDSASTDIHTGIPGSGVVTGTWQPDARAVDPSVVTDTSPRTAFLSSFNEAPVQGNWTLFLADMAASDTSILAGWGLTVTSEIRDFAIWDANGNSSGIGGAGTWTASGSAWATSAVGTSTAAQNVSAQLVFDGAGGVVNVSGTVNPEAGMRFKSNGYQLSGGTVNLAGASAAANTITVDPAVTVGLSSVITGSNGLTKAGAGTLDLSGDNTYSGGTVVSGGSLRVSNTIGSATGSGNVTVTTGKILGTGIIAPASGGSLILGNGAAVSIGDVGDTTGKKLAVAPVSGTMSTIFQSGSVLEFDLFSGAGAGDNASNENAADMLQWGGTLGLESNVTLRLNNLNGMTGFAGGDRWKLFDWTALSGSAPTGIFDPALLELPTLEPLLEWDFSTLYSNGTIGITLVPEPSRGLLLLGGVLALGLRRRR